jgi:hypothetical protein
MIIRNQFKAINFVVIFIYLTSCRCDKQHTYRNIEKSKDYFASFNDGSFWVFKETSGRKENDTLILLNNNTSLDFKYTESNCDGDYFETITYALVSTKTNDSIKVKLFSGPNIDKYSLNGYFHGCYLINYHTIKKSTGEFQPYAKDTIDLFENYSINGKQFKDVIKIVHTEFRNAYTGFVPEFLHSPKIGLIEFKVYDTSLNQALKYQLIDYNIK